MSNQNVAIITNSNSEQRQMRLVLFALFENLSGLNEEYPPRRLPLVGR